MSKSPFITFSREDWRQYRHDTPLTLSEAEITRLQGINETLSISEVEEIYLPLSRLLNLYVQATQELHSVSGRFLNHSTPKVPYIIGVSGSVAVGKSTTSRILQALLSRWPDHPRVEIVMTDGFLFPNAVLEERHLMLRKGFPESYDLHRLIQFLIDLKAGNPNLEVPLYSHHHYDIIADQTKTINQPDIVILEGLNVLQVRAPKEAGSIQRFVSDFFDFSIYVDAETSVIMKWYLDRFVTLRERAQGDKTAYFHRFVNLSDKDALDFARQVWHETNEANLVENILPYKERTNLMLVKGEDHSIEKVLLRKL